MKDCYIEWIPKLLSMIVMVAITIVLYKFIFLTAKEVLWLVCGFLCWAIWDSEVDE